MGKTALSTAGTPRLFTELAGKLTAEFGRELVLHLF